MKVRNTVLILFTEIILLCGFADLVFAESVEYPYFTGSNPYEGVDIFIGSIYKDKDPDYKWLVENKEKLGRLAREEYDLYYNFGDDWPLETAKEVHWTREENDRIVLRFDHITDKFDIREEKYKSFKTSHGAELYGGEAYEFHRPLYILNPTKMVSPAPVAKIVKVISMNDYIRKTLEWYYNPVRIEVRKEVKVKGMQDLLSKLFIYVNSDKEGYKYDSYFSERDKRYLEEIYGDAKAYLEKTRANSKFGQCSIGVSKPIYDYFSLGGVIARFVLDKKKNEVMMELINAKDDPGNPYKDDRDRYKDRAVFDLFNYLLVDGECNVYAIEPGEIKRLEELEGP